MTTMVWVEQEWTDYKLKWDPDEYGGITKVSQWLILITLIITNNVYVINVVISNSGTALM